MKKELASSKDRADALVKDNETLQGRMTELKKFLNASSKIRA